MLNFKLVVFFALFSVFAAIFIYFTYKQRKKSTISVTVEDITESFPTNLSIHNAEAYIKKLSLKEKIELSWKFLYEITEYIVNKFSPEDKKAVNEEGYKLLNNGMRYEHVVDFGIKRSLVNISTNIEQSGLGQSQSQSFNKKM